MPEFKIKMPDGQIRTVSGPDRDGAMAFAMANYNPATTSAPTTAAPAEVNPEGVSIGRAFKRGAIETYAGLPTALAVADIQKFQDAFQLQQPGGVNALAYDELMKTRVPLEAMAGRSVNLDVDTLEGRRSVDALQDRYNLKPGEKVDYLQTLDKRIENATNLRSNSQDEIDAQWERIKTNAQYAGDLQDKAAAIPRGVRGGIYAEEYAKAPDTWKGWLSTVTNDPVGFVEFIGETTAESGAQIVAGLATSLLTRSPKAGALVMGSGGFAREYGNEVASFLEENGIDLSDPTAAKQMFNDPQLMDEANSRGVTRGVVIAAADFAGQGLVAREFFKRSLARQVGVQMGTEGLGEAGAAQAVGDDFSFKDTITEALAGGVSAAPEAMVAGQAPWRSKIEGDPAYGGAAADLARTLREISEAQGNNLKDVRAGGGAKATLEAAHEKISGQISAIATHPDVKARLSPKNAETLDQLLEDYAAAATAIRQGKNKVKSKVTKENADAIVRLLGPTSLEAGQLQQLFDQGDVLTDLFQDGLKGGVSQFTDFLNPFTDNSGNYDPNRSLSTIGSLYGASVVGPLKSAGIVAAGRAFDAATGRRSKVNRFVTKLEELVGQDAPQGRSLIADAQLEKQQAEQAKADAAAAQAAQEAEDANIVSTLAGMTGNATDGSPLGTVAVGTGIPTEEIQTVVSELRLKHPADSKNPNDVAVNKVLDDAQAGLNGEQRPIRALTQLVNIVNDHLNASLMDGGSSVQRTSLPDGDLARAKAIQMGNAPKMDAAPAAQASPAPNVDTTAPAQPTVNGNQTTTSENYQAGIQANRDTALKLQEQVLDTLDLQNRQATNRPGGNLTPTMLEDEAQALYVALEAVQTENMPIEAMEEVQQLLVDEGVSQENVDKFYKPYVDRVKLQQKRKASMLKQAQATQAEIQGGPAVNTETAPAPSVLEQAQAGQQPTTNQRLAESLARLQETEAQRTSNLNKPVSDANLEANSRVLESVLDDYGVKGKITNASSDPAVAVYELELAPGLKASRVIGLSDAIARSMSAPSAQVSTVPGRSAIRIEIPNQPISDDARVIPVPYNNAKMQEVFGVQNPVPGGNYIDLDTKQDVTGTTYTGGSVKVVDGKPVLETNDTTAEPATKADGPKVKVNLFKQKAGWKWIDYDGPATVVSTTIRGKHVYSLDTDLQNPVSLETYPNQPSEPRLRPTTQGEVQTGNIIGNISVRGKPHPVYDKVTVSTPIQEVSLEQGVYSENPVPAADDSRTPNIEAPQIIQDTAMGPKTIVVAGQIKPEEQQGPRNTNHGLLPHLRTTAPARDGKSVILASTKNANAGRQIEGLTEVLSRHDDPAGSPEAWSAYQGDALATSDVPVQPNGFINDLNNGGAQELLGKLTPGQIADADHGFENAAMFRQAYINNEIGIADTGRLFLWSFLSRGVSPYTQESLFLDSFEGIDQWIEAAANKTLKERLPEYKAWAAQTAPQGSGQPGAGAMHNLNAFGVDFLMKMSQDVSPEDNRSRLQYIHDLMSDPNTTGNQVRREFTKIGEGVGIDNKVVSFTLLVAGYNDVMVLDRVQIRQMYNDGRFDGINLYDGYKEKDPKDGKSKVVTGSGLATQTNGAKGLMIYEAMEKSLSQRLPKIYGDIGRPDAASVGRYHWETWVASSEQEASHGTIDAILAKAQGDPNPLDGVTAKEGEYGAYAYGAKYGLENGQPMFKYSIPDRGEFKFTVPDFREFLDEIKKPKNKVVPAKFSVSNSGNAPWYTRDGVNLDALAEKATEYGNQVPTADGQLRQDQAVPNGRQLDASSGPDNSIPPALLSPPGPAGGRTPRASDGGASKGRTLARVALAAVKKFVPPVKAAFQVGKRGTPEENGIQSIDQALRLAHTLGITVRLFDSQEEMYASRLAAYGSGDPAAEASFYRKGPETGGKGAEGTVFGLNPGALLNDGSSVSNIQALSDLLHEIAHGMTLGPLDLNGSQVEDTLFTNPLTGESDRAPMGSFAGSAMRPLLEQTGDADIMAELDNLQMNVDTYTTKDPSQRHAVREVRKLMDNLKDWKGYYQKQFDAGQISQAEVDTGVANREEQADYYTNYMQSVRELAVDPVLVYLINPKLAKAVMPKTAALIRQQFNNAGNNKVKFFNHPAAIVMATVMAMLAQAMAEEEEEKQRMQMPPGALSPPPPGMGALSA